MPGYIVKLNGDTLKGLIDYKNWDKSPLSIQFRTSLENSNNQSFSNKDILAFCVNRPQGEETFRSFKLKYDISSERLNNLSTTEDPQYTEETIFIKLVVSGELSLYRLKDEDGRVHYFIAKQNAIPEELLYKTYQPEGSTTLMYNMNFKGTLLDYMSNCKTIDPTNVKKLKYWQEEIAKLVESYNQCRGSFSKTTAQEKTEIHFGLIAGVRIASLHAGGLSETFGIGTNEEAKFNTSTNIAAGLELRINIPRTGNKLSILGELLFASQKFESAPIPTLSVYPPIESRYTFNSSYLKLNTLLTYTYPKGLVKPFAQLGMSNGYAIAHQFKNELFEKGSNTNLNSTSYNMSFSHRKYEQGLLLGIGADYKNERITIRYERSNGFSDSMFSTSLSSVYLMLSYSF